MSYVYDDDGYEASCLAQEDKEHRKAARYLIKHPNPDDPDFSEEAWDIVWNKKHSDSRR